MLKAFLTSCLVTFGLMSVANAAVIYDEPTKSLRITGVSTMHQTTEVWKALEEHEVDTVYMEGPGGDYYAGLSLGRTLRKAEVRVIIPSGKACISACAFAALGAKEVFVDGELWFHVPFTRGVDAGATIREITQNYGVAYLHMAEYLVEMMEDDAAAFRFAEQLLKLTSVCKFVVDTGGPIKDVRDYCTGKVEGR